MKLHAATLGGMFIKHTRAGGHTYAQLVVL
ncbi:hypothetical protein ROSA5918_22290 [Roseateles saccharophilus]